MVIGPQKIRLFYWHCYFRFSIVRSRVTVDPEWTGITDWLNLKYSILVSICRHVKNSLPTCSDELLFIGDLSITSPAVLVDTTILWWYVFGPNFSWLVIAPIAGSSPIHRIRLLTLSSSSTFAEWTGRLQSNLSVECTGNIDTSERLPKGVQT